MRSFRALLGYMGPYKWAAILAPLLMALEVTMDLAQPRLLQDVVDVGIANRDLGSVVHTGSLMVGAALIGVVGGVGCSILSTIAGLSFGADIRADLFRRVQSLSFSNLGRLETGHLITRLTNDVDQVQEAAMMLLRILVRAPLMMMGSLVMAVVTSPKLSLLVLAIAPLLILTFTVASKRAHALFLIVQERLDRLNVVMLENLSGVRLVKAFVRSKYEAGRFARANGDLTDQTIKASIVVAVVRPIMMLLIDAGVAGVIWFGGWQVHHGDVRVGQILAFVNYLMQLLGSTMMVGMLMMRVARADASAERVTEVLRSRPDIEDSPNASELERPQGRVEFDDVTFTYDGEDSEQVLKGVSFRAEPGETLAILGPTGSGKSTLVHLVPRLYDVSGGQVLIDGRDVRSLRQESLRRSIAVVLQDAILFSGSVRENIRYGRPNASKEEVQAAARMAQAHEFITQLPEGYDTVLGQRGVNLSGGQKQRLSIARALICRPSVLVMDDCTSAVDATTEAAILGALETWDHSCTRLLVAQRIGSAVSADRVIVLEDGKIAGEGTHQELLRTSPVYQDIVRSQLGGEEVAHV